MSYKCQTAFPHTQKTAPSFVAVAPGGTQRIEEWSGFDLLR